MDYVDHVAAVERETAALAAALRAGDMDAQVPTCPEWKLADLAHHVGGVAGFWTHALCEGTGRAKTPFDEHPPDGAAAEWFEQVAGHLVAELRAAPPETEVRTWVPGDQTAAFVGRRMAHEMAVHRFDAQSAVGAPAPIESALAADGIEEIFVMVDAWPDAGRGTGETLHLHGADRDDEWLIAMNPDGLDVCHEHAKGDLALRGNVGDLELVLYDRPPLGTVERFGNESVLDAWHRVFKFG
jgi:uncharacterized protein (TIGR03083 family)